MSCQTCFNCPPNVIGPTGNTGATGPTGPQGIQGLPGEIGSLFYVGDGLPIFFPVSGTNHLYLNKENGNVYQFQYGIWSFVANIKGNQTNYGIGGNTTSANSFSTTTVDHNVFPSGVIYEWTSPNYIANVNITTSWNVGITGLVDGAITLKMYDDSSSDLISALAITFLAGYSNPHTTKSDIKYLENVPANTVFTFRPVWRTSSGPITPVAIVGAYGNHVTVHIEYNSV